VKAIDSSTKVLVYRNAMYALQWLESDRVVMYDEAYAGFFLRDKAGVIVNAQAHEGDQYVWNYTNASAAKYRTDVCIGGPNAADNPLINGIFLDDPGPGTQQHPMQEYISNMQRAAHTAGMTRTELQALSNATYATIIKMRQNLNSQGKMMWLNGVDNADPFMLTYGENCTADYGQCGWWHDPQPGAACAAFFQQRCDNASYGDVTLGVLRQGSWQLSIATLLLLRQERGWLVSDWWQGTSNITALAWVSDLDRDVGSPTEKHCAEEPTRAGVFSRQWSGGKVTVDCSDLSVVLPGRLKSDDIERAVPTGLQYFGWYRTHFGPEDFPITGPHSNLYQAVDAGADVNALAAAKAAGQDILLAVESLFPGLQTDQPDFVTKWEPMVPVLRERLANGSIIGFNLGDELICSGMKTSVLHEYARTVRDSFPRQSNGKGAIIWLNACVCSMSNSLFCTQHNASSNQVNFTIPAAVDWMSVDMYHMDGPVDNWVRDNVREFYEQNIYPNLTEHQRVLLVPGAFGSDGNRHPNGSYICDRACYDRMCAKDAVDFYDWAKSDSRVVGITPWNWVRASIFCANTVMYITHVHHTCMHVPRKNFGLIGLSLRHVVCHRQGARTVSRTMTRLGRATKRQRAQRGSK
jgi:hypothetical protein